MPRSSGYTWLCLPPFLFALESACSRFADCSALFFIFPVIVCETAASSQRVGWFCLPYPPSSRGNYSTREAGGTIYVETNLILKQTSIYFPGTMLMGNLNHSLTRSRVDVDCKQSYRIRARMSWASNLMWIRGNRYQNLQNFWKMLMLSLQSYNRDADENANISDRFISAVLDGASESFLKYLTGPCCAKEHIGLF